MPKRSLQVIHLPNKEQQMHTITALVTQGLCVRADVFQKTSALSTNLMQITVDTETSLPQAKLTIQQVTAVSNTPALDA